MVSPIQSPRASPAASPLHEPVGTPPRAAAQAFTARSDFLNHRLQRGDLEHVAVLMDELFGQLNWAITGSTALLIHAHAAPVADIKARLPGDVDLLINHNLLGNVQLTNAQHDRGFSFHEVDGEEKNHILDFRSPEHPVTLKVDLVSDKHGGFGQYSDIDLGISRQYHLPVIKLETLQSALKCRDEGSSANKESDLAVIVRLLAVKGQGSGTHPEAAGQDACGQPNLKACRRRPRSDDDDSAEGPSTRAATVRPVPWRLD